MQYESKYMDWPIPSKRFLTQGHGHSVLEIVEKSHWVRT